MKWHLLCIGTLVLTGISSLAQAESAPNRVSIVATNVEIKSDAPNADVRLSKRDSSGNVVLAVASGGICYHPVERSMCLDSCQQEAQSWLNGGCHQQCQTSQYPYDCVTTCEMGVMNILASCEADCCIVGG